MRRAVAVVWLLLLCSLTRASISAQTAPPKCDSMLVFTNIYGVANPDDGYRLMIKDPANMVVWYQAFNPGTSNATTDPMSLRGTFNGTPFDPVPGVTYTINLQAVGFGVCCGAFTNFTITVSADIELLDMSGGNTPGCTQAPCHVVTDFVPPGNLLGKTYKLRRDASVSICPILVDPVPDLLNTNFNGTTRSFLADANKWATTGRIVDGVAADGVTRIIVRIPATGAGQQFDVEVMTDEQTPSRFAGGFNPIHNDGGLSDVSTATASTDFTSTYTITAQLVDNGHGGQRPEAFVVYRAPEDFVRAGYDSIPADEDQARRQVFLRFTSGTVSYNYPITVVRPPVMLIHGLWGDASTWDKFGVLTNDPRFAFRKINYDEKVPGVVATTPAYAIADVSAAALGLEFNALLAFRKFQLALYAFNVGALRSTRLTVAATQVDVVAHSMGGVITRTMPYAVDDFYSFGNYFSGAVHKVVTIGTPHLGSPLATNLLEQTDATGCVRDIFGSWMKQYSLASVTFNDGSIYNGAMEDLQGDGTGAQLSSALRQLKGHTYKAMPTAVIAGFYRSDGLPPDDHFLDKLGQIANAACLAKVHSVNSILLANFYGAGWLAMMGGLNDGIVPVTSALELEPATLDVNFFRGIHGPGTSPLFGYIPPTLLDGTAVPNRVIQLLNTTPRNEDFRRFGQQ